MTALLSCQAVVYPEVEYSDTEIAYLQPLVFTICFPGPVPRRLIQNNIVRLYFSSRTCNAERARSPLKYQCRCPSNIGESPSLRFVPVLGALTGSVSVLHPL